MKTASARQPRLPAILCLWMAASAPAWAQLLIARPIFGVPEFAEPGGTFHAEIKAQAGLPAAGWTVVLANDLRSWEGAVEQTSYGLLADNDSAEGYRLTIRVPADIPPEVFQLVVAHPDAGAATNENAVGVIPSFEEDFYILHYTDLQAGGLEPTKPETGMCGNNGSIREIYWHAPAIRLINPRFLLDTGDELDDPYYAGSTAHYHEYAEALGQTGVPVLATRGNNDDMISAEEWRTTRGVESYSIAIGSFAVFQKDYNENHFSAWFTNAYAASFTNTAIGFRLYGQHFSDSGASWLPPAGQDPGLMLVGHIHANTVVQSNPYAILSTAAAHNKGSVGLFEFERTPTNWVCTTLTNTAEAQFQLMSSGSVSRLQNTFSFPNDGTSFTNTSTILNQLPNRFRFGRLRFLMPYSSTGYAVSNGVKLAEYPFHGGSNMAVLVRVDIAPNDTTVVDIHPAPESARIDGLAMGPPWSLRFHSETNRLYSLLCCTNLADNQWSLADGLVPRAGIGGEDQFQAPGNSPVRFFRLGVTSP